MALAALAARSDLTARNVSWTVADAVVDTLLAEASDSVREAAGHPIGETTGTVQLVGAASQWLYLPAPPVASVASVSITEPEQTATVVTDWTLMLGGRLWRMAGWAPKGLPSVVTVEYTHGYATVPPTVVGLVCGLVAGALSHVEAGTYDAGIGVQSIRIDDASETYVTGDQARSGLMELTEATRHRLAAQFGGGGHVVGITA